ncbi:hypothetical protein ACU5JM_08365 [Rhodococcus erythropolis]|uniref:hypothetical protein n=1 Tax=Rhodococcus erythropolis TaxID=1833 RepID=UPI00406BD6B4
MSNLVNLSTDQLLAEVREREYKEVEIDDVSPSPEIGVMTHAECVAAAAEYMRKRSDVVLPEFYSHNAELPDVIAFNARNSIVIECKVSRSDFLVDRKKLFRINQNAGMGDDRYYCCPKGMIKPEELPQGWGLLWIYPSGQVRKQRESRGFKKNIEAEHYLLFYYARRAYYAGVHDTVLEYRGYDG